MKIKELKSLKPYLKLSPTFKLLYTKAVRNKVSLGNTQKLPKKMKNNTIYLPDIFKSKMSPDEAVLLAHEMRHAGQSDKLTFLEMEFDAFAHQKIVRKELKAAGCKLTSTSKPLSKKEIPEAYKDYIT